ncbi:LysR family transcriptional regulator [Oscillibacter valericigenes]|uniref:LysR family transcriptional regulator n=1 Tax=Oscillibacter valericigenes TaxID=351091 RepID=UPI001F3718AE|nr:LysR family transcriptional regulator [Oscillibacter valericigenes]MCF2664308.1 LysR family transcriptional regulator [Oscillibacter valericigenes]
MNINQLRYFVAVAEQRSFTKAANQYYLSQTAVTQQVRALEETLGVQLLDRNSRPVSLTPAGAVFLTEAKAILERMNTAVSRARDASTGLVGSVRIGYTKGYERSDLSNKLRAFHRDYPNILLTCFRCDTDMLAAGLLNGEYDIIFTWDSTNIRQESQVELRMVERARLVVALYGSHPFARRTALRRSELKNETILFMTPSSTGASFGDDHFMQLYQQAGYLPNILLRSNDVESILMMVAAEEGISILPAYCTDKLTNADNLIFVPLIGEEETEDILAVWRKDDPSQALQHFLERVL